MINLETPKKHATLVDQADKALLFHNVVGYEIPVVSGLIRSSKRVCRNMSRQPSRTARSGLPAGFDAATLKATGTTVSNL